MLRVKVNLKELNSMKFQDVFLDIKKFLEKDNPHLQEAFNKSIANYYFIVEFPDFHSEPPYRSDLDPSLCKYL
jgi:hypothetical protein